MEKILLFLLILSARWLRKFADEGNAEAQFVLGFYYSEGLGVPKDDVQSAFWYLKAADQGHAEARYNLGFGYYRGKSVTQGITQAAPDIATADQGNAESMNAATTAPLHEQAREKISIPVLGSG